MPFLQVMMEFAPTSTPVRAATTVRVLFFGPVRVKLGVAQAEFDCADGIDLEMFWNELTARFPELAPMRPTIRLARDGEFLDGSGHVQPGDEIALIPPVSGG
jgi:molybdopterin converting factor small subunit